MYYLSPICYHQIPDTGEFMKSKGLPSCDARELKIKVQLSVEELILWKEEHCLLRWKQPCSALGCSGREQPKAAGSLIFKGFIILVTVDEAEASLASSHLKGPMLTITMLSTTEFWRWHIHI